MAYKYDLEFIGYYNSEIKISVVKIKGKGLHELQTKEALGRVMFCLCKGQSKGFTVKEKHLENLYRDIVKNDESFNNDAYRTWVRGMRSDINQLQLQSYCNSCRKNKLPDINSCRTSKRNVCIVFKYFQQDRTVKNKGIKINEVLNAILNEKTFRNSHTNISNLVEIKNDLFQIKNIGNTTFPEEPEDTGESSVNRPIIDSKEKIKEIVKDLIGGYNLQDVWIEICTLRQSDDNYEPLNLFLKILTIAKIAEELSRDGFGVKYDSIFPFLIEKNHNTIKAKMLKHAKDVFLKELKQYYSVGNITDLMNKINTDNEFKKVPDDTIIISQFCEIIKDIDKNY